MVRSSYWKMYRSDLNELIVALGCFRPGESVVFRLCRFQLEQEQSSTCRNVTGLISEQGRYVNKVS